MKKQKERNFLDVNQERILKQRADRAIKNYPSGQRVTECKQKYCMWPFCMC